MDDELNLPLLDPIALVKHCIVRYEDVMVQQTSRSFILSDRKSNCAFFSFRQRSVITLVSAQSSPAKRQRRYTSEEEADADVSDT
jgi:hypothetical protein